MNKDNLEYQHDNLRFFENVIFDSERAFSVAISIIDGNFAPILQSMSLIETALWLRLGIEIGFFDAEDAALYLASIEDALSTAWEVLVRTKVLSSETWCDFMSLEPKPTFMKDKFFGLQEGGGFKKFIDSKYLENQQQCFLEYLLLTSEVIFDDTTMVFLENIAWATEKNWESRVQGYSTPFGVSVEDLYVGLANHVQYLDQLQKYRHMYTRAGPEVRHPASADDMWTLHQKVRQIVSQRLILDRPHAKERCLRLSSEILAKLNQPGPEWQEVRRSIFLQIAQITEINHDEIPRLWSDFVDNMSKDRNRAMRKGRSSSFEGSKE